MIFAEPLRRHQAAGAGRTPADVRSSGDTLRAVSGAEAKNLEAISKGIDRHNATCAFPASEVRMNPFEVERLGWKEIRGIPIVADPQIGTGRFRIVCSREGGGGVLEEAEAIGAPVEVGPSTPGQGPG
jgi:hypothetical protein